MKLGVWYTKHEIADTVAFACRYGAMDSELINTSRLDQVPKFDCHIGYGILRGMDKVMKACQEQDKPFFHLDNGYFNPGHYDGYYRISYKGTQAKWHEGIPQASIDFELEPWQDNKGGYILICPPTNAVSIFFNHHGYKQEVAVNKALHRNPARGFNIRNKGDTNPIEWGNIKGVITFNSSIGWQALQRGIPCVSDSEHSIVGSYYTEMLCKKGLDYNFGNVMLIDREPLFRAMAAHQFTLAEIREGKAWELLEHYLERHERNPRVARA